MIHVLFIRYWILAYIWHSWRFLKASRVADSRLPDDFCGTYFRPQKVFFWYFFNFSLLFSSSFWRKFHAFHVLSFKNVKLDKNGHSPWLIVLKIGFYFFVPESSGDDLPKRLPPPFHFQSMNFIKHSLIWNVEFF